jgi:hypothetical protein
MPRKRKEHNSDIEDDIGVETRVIETEISVVEKPKKKKKSIAFKDAKPNEDGTYTCPVCNTTGVASAMQRFHFENCRRKKV